MKWLVVSLSLLLGLAAAADELQIRKTPARSPAVVREGVVYAPLTSLAEELGVKAWPAGEGYLVAEQAGDLSVPAGKVQVRGKLLDLLEEAGDPLVPAEAFCLALGGKVTHPERSVLNLIPPTAPAAAAAKIVSKSDPASFYFSQIRSSTNPTGSRDNGNCGPACLAMAARAFGRWPLQISDSDLPGMMTWIRHEMGHTSDEAQGTNIPWLTKPAEKMKLHPKLFQNFDELPNHLARGRMVIVAGQLSNLGLPGGAHAMLAVSQVGDEIVINDPGLFYKQPGTRIQAVELRRFFILGIALGDS